MKGIIWYISEIIINQLLFLEHEWNVYVSTNFEEIYMHVIITDMKCHMYFLEVVEQTGPNLVYGSDHHVEQGVNAYKLSVPVWSAPCSPRQCLNEKKYIYILLEK